MTTNVIDESMPIIITATTCLSYTTQATCTAAGCYWWNGSCHSLLPACTDLNNSIDCLANGCYWYENSCHDTPQLCIGKPQSECISPCSWWCASCHDVALTEILDQKQETFGLNDWVGAARWCAQSFIPTVNYITKLELYLQRLGNITAGLLVDIRDQIDDFTLPPILSILIPYDDIPTTQQWITLDLNLIGSCAVVTPGLTHYLVLHTENNSGGSQNCYRIGFYNGTTIDDKYLRGQLFVTATGGTTWVWTSYPYYDDMFRIYGM